ncbi:conserved Plasmodium protein, unknown function [Plasmodium berghei]|uniref:Dynein light chain, putative n=2 Tax=Plasmodium berghei TaxID=5821 RepID=A0A509ANU5_PLABA|nr:dynein light chain, putative [Plasmodium berghei ANKA]SCM18056.1 conserved Plasmodium protein, unknown function [Plasmodium berghei]VUC56382.1 dynein light chain, putative [Plasmodium berghei ANKA]|eukprot:XP_034422184.1 dynein light chain, putative [Plasmodium berghei ANKA]
MEKNYKIVKYGNNFNVNKELKSYMLKTMKEYKDYFEKKFIKNCNLENNINLMENLEIKEDNDYNEDVFIKNQKNFHLYDFFNLSLLFPIKILNQNGKKIIQLISEDNTPNDINMIQTILKNIEQTEMDKLRFFHIENIIYELIDELIRQIAVDCPKRGFSLIVINNEIKKNIGYYKRLIEIIEHNNNMNTEKFNEMQRKYNIMIEQLSVEENNLKEKLADIQNELELLRNTNKKKIQENRNKMEIQYDLLKHNESLLETIKEIYDKQGEI